MVGKQSFNQKAWENALQTESIHPPSVSYSAILECLFTGFSDAALWLILLSNFSVEEMSIVCISNGDVIYVNTYVNVFLQLSLLGPPYLKKDYT